MAEFMTLTEMLAEKALPKGNELALNSCTNGLWRHSPISQFCCDVVSLSVEMRQIGISRGDTVGILAESSTEWLLADFAIMCTGAVSVPLFVAFSEQHMVFKAKDSEVKSICVFGAAAWKAFEPYASLFSNIITDQIETGTANTHNLYALLKKGSHTVRSAEGVKSILRTAVKPDDLATIIYTSGSTGMPKGVEITQANFVSQIKGANKLFGFDANKDCALSILPLAHSFQRIIAYLLVSQGISIYFADDVHRIKELLNEVKPTVMTVVPRILEKTYDRMIQSGEQRGGISGFLSRWALHRLNGSFRPESSHCLNALASLLVGHRLSAAMGGRLTTTVVGGAHMPVELLDFFNRAGLEIYEGYGLTEASPIIATNYPGRRKIGTVGQPLPGVEVKISPKGEILAHGPNVMRKYHNNEKETARAIDSDGWLHTGDSGEMDEDGFLRVTGRLDDLCKLSNGEYMTPAPIEQALCRIRSVSAAIAVGENRPFVTCLIFPEPSCRDRRQLAKQVDAALQRLNTELDHWEEIRDYTFIDEPPSVENGQLTPTLKLRRHSVLARYSDTIDAMYSPAHTKEGGP